MTLNCSECDADVPEGASVCPQCGAGLKTVMFGKSRGLTKTLIGKAIELRHSIPWASPSAVQPVEVVADGEDPAKRRPWGLVLLGAAVVAAGLAAYLMLPARQPKPEASAEPAPAPQEPEAPPAPPAQAPVVAPPPERPAEVVAKPPPAPAAKRGALVVKAAYKGKPIAVKVRVNGKVRGTTPLTLALAPSKYTITLEKTGYRRETRAGVRVVAGKKSTLVVALRK